MNFKERDFIPMLFGGDINTYSVARAFYERYKVKSYTFGKFATGPSYQRIIEYTPNPKIDTDEVFMKTVKSFCSKHADKTVVLVGCGDSYVALISKHKNELPKNTIAPYIDFDLMNSLQQKETFYKLCEKHGVDYPGTIIHIKEMGHDFEMNFPFPVILKPSDSIQYWEHPFDTQKKVYTIKDKKELDQVHFHELAAKSELHRELIYRECEHLVKLYMDLCQTDKSYNTILCGLVTMKRDDVKSKLQRDIYETAVKVPRELDMEQELALLTRAARKVYEDYFPGEGGLPE